jgi:hypothetical protein
VKFSDYDLLYKKFLYQNYTEGNEEGQHKVENELLIGLQKKKSSNRDIKATVITVLSVVLLLFQSVSLMSHHTLSIPYKHICMYREVKIYQHVQNIHVHFSLNKLYGTVTIFKVILCYVGSSRFYNCRRFYFKEARSNI